MYLQRLKDLREDAELTQEQIAKQLQITKQQYQLYESGKRSIPIKLCRNLACFYNISLDYICGITRYPTKIFLEEPPTKFKIVPRSTEIAEAYKKAPDEIKKAIDILLKIWRRIQNGKQSFYLHQGRRIW